jgi:hypothetical protein
MQSRSGSTPSQPAELLEIGGGLLEAILAVMT